MESWPSLSSSKRKVDSPVAAASVIPECIIGKFLAGRTLSLVPWPVEQEPLWKGQEEAPEAAPPIPSPTPTPSLDDVSEAMLCLRTNCREDLKQDLKEWWFPTVSDP